MSTAGGFIDDKEHVDALCKTDKAKELRALLEAVPNINHRYNWMYHILGECDTDEKCQTMIDLIKKKNLSRNELFDAADDLNPDKWEYIEFEEE